ncbi:type-F conjugative transfer system protein TraW [Pseudoduganella umbonata]|nr:type-F conjugative transfer system protein TraW [Pseudoduganella umbonata]MBB3221712.1 conjugal transfer pilus assembly protein TraW [Pseudoduganella umbonata]
MLAWIERRLAAQQASGALAAKVDAAVSRAKTTLENPAPVAGITRAKTSRTAYFDPTYTAPRTIASPAGTILIAAGMKINPLTTVSLSRPLIFFDARDRDQVAFAQRYLDSREGLARPVLVGGSYVDLMHRWRIPVYFDQQGALVKRLGIRHVPAIVAQDGLRLRIDEIAL